MEKFTVLLRSILFSESISILALTLGVLLPEATQSTTPILYYKGHTDSVRAAAFVSNGATTEIVSASSDGTLRLWNSLTGITTATYRGHNADVFGVASNPRNTSEFISASLDLTAVLWNKLSGTGIRNYSMRAALFAIAFNPHNSSEWLAGAGDFSAKLFEKASGRLIVNYSGAGNVIAAVAFHPFNDSEILTASWDGSVSCWNKYTGSVLRSYSGHTPGSYVRCVAYNPSNGSEFVSGAADATIALYNSAGVVRRFAGHTGAVNAVAYNPLNTSQLLSASADRTLLLWETATGRLLQNFSGGHTGAINFVAFFPNSSAFLSASADGTLLLWSEASQVLEPVDETELVHGEPITPAVRTVSIIAVVVASIAAVLVGIVLSRNRTGQRPHDTDLHEHEGHTVGDDTKSEPPPDHEKDESPDSLSMVSKSVSIASADLSERSSLD